MSERKRSTKRSDSWDLTVKPLTDSERKASSRVADRILGKLEPGATDVSISEQLSAPEPLSITATESVVAEQPSGPELLSLSVTLTGEHKGATSLPHLVLDGLFPLLHPHEQLVYLRLFRLTHGFRRDLCKVGFPALAKACSISRAGAIRAVDKLEGRGLIERVGAVGRGANAERGNQYRVRLPEILSRSEQPSVSENPSRPARPMIRNEREHETAPASAAPSVYDLRTRAAYLWEQSGHTLTHDDLAEKLRDVYHGQGIAPDERVIAAAIEGKGR